MKRLLVCFALFVATSVSAHADTSTLFDTLKNHDGKTYHGRMSYSRNTNDEMDKPMQITVKVVSDDEIRIPLQVGEDRSRTWILTRSEAGVLLKHDHRHADGTPDEVTNYGGLASDIKLGNQLIFPADGDTTTMLPDASSNVWSMRLSPDGGKFYYYLERHSQPRFEAAFDIVAP